MTPTNNANMKEGVYMSISQKKDKNILIFYLYSMHSDLIMLGPIIVLFFLSRGLSFTQIMILQAICSVSMMLFEIPTGIIADTFKRKHTLFLSNLILGISVLILVFATNFYLFALAEILGGFAIALNSGSEQALLYDDLIKKRKEKDFVKIQGHATFLMGLVMAVGCILSGYLFEMHKTTPIIISAIWVLLGSIIIIFFNEEKITTTSRKTSNTFKQILTKGFMYAKNHKKVRTIILYSLFFSFFFAIAFWAYPVYMDELNVPVRYFGFVFAGMNLIYAFASKYAYLYVKATKGFTLTSLSWIISIGFIFSGIIRSIIGLFSFTGEQIIRGVQPIVTDKYINKHIPSQMRATIMSYKNLLTTFTSMASKIIFGILIDNFGIFDTRIILGVVMFGGALFFSQYFKKTLNT